MGNSGRRRKWHYHGKKINKPENKLLFAGDTVCNNFEYTKQQVIIQLH